MSNVGAISFEMASVKGGRERICPHAYVIQMNPNGMGLDFVFSSSSYLLRCRKVHYNNSQSVTWASVLLITACCRMGPFALLDLF